MLHQVVKYVFQGLGLLGLAFAIWMVMVSSQAVPVAPPVVTPAKPPYAAYIGAAGIIEARTLDTQIGTQVAGLVTEIPVALGSRVKRGDPLFKLDDRSLNAQLAVQRATLQTARARVREADASLADVRNRLALAEAVKDPRAISKEDLTSRRNAVHIAAAHLASAHADAKLAEAQVTQTETNIELLIVRAPVDGEVLQINTRVGEYAQAGPLTTPLMLFGNIDRLHVRVDIDENDAWRFHPEAHAMAFLRGNPLLNTPLIYEWTEPFVIPKRSLTGGTTERVDTRVMQVVYSFDRAQLPVYVGQQMDVFIEASPVKSEHVGPLPQATSPGTNDHGTK
jgi:RND family efflux transporter MFP subunit